MATMIYLFSLLMLAVAISGNGMESEIINICGPRIIGGHEIDISDIPFQVSLHAEYYGFFCSGVIISSNWILTAAHCVDNLFISKAIQIRFGSNYTATGGSLIVVKQVIKHPNYTRLDLDYDLSLLELKEAIPLDDQLYAAELPSQDEQIDDGLCVQVSGWGSTYTRVDQLRATYVPIVSPEECRAAYDYFWIVVTERMVCAGFPEGGRDACYGDSGGPLVDGRKLLGIVSWGMECAQPSFPGVYARVASAREWIAEIAGV
ncbi:trypsin 5G1-like [Malaya genurostris]|uniref:trypsin 5G1-like n=1 Tax=Malaya genurostris TaxID=325434 RepID=UPI0026F40039|nr:trypsin 5G1-like [Malaya genurostris]